MWFFFRLPFESDKQLIPLDIKPNSPTKPTAQQSQPNKRRQADRERETATPRCIFPVEDLLPGAVAAWGSTVLGLDEGDGWLRAPC